MDSDICEIIIIFKEIVLSAKFYHRKSFFQFVGRNLTSICAIVQLFWDKSSVKISRKNIKICMQNVQENLETIPTIESCNKYDNLYKKEGN